MNTMQKQAARKFVECWTFRRGSEKGEDQQFWNSLLGEVLGMEDVASRVQYQVPVPKKGTTKFLDAWIPETRVLIEHKSRGIKLDAPQSGHGGKTPFEQALEYNIARPFSEKARWLSRDPLEEQGGLNLYGFCGNSPTCSYDPHGFQAHFDVKITPIRVGIILSANNHKSSYPRAATFHSGDLKFSCDKNCRIKVSGELSLWIEMLEQNNSRWDVSFPQYLSSVLVSEDLNAYNHELDHFYTWKEFYTFLKTANSYDGRPYKDCKAKALDLQTRYSRFKAMTQRHSRAFDQTGRNMGGQYSSHPLDTSKFKWE